MRIEYQIIIILLSVGLMIIISKYSGKIIHMDWFYAGQISKSYIKLQNDLDVMMHFYLKSEHLLKVYKPEIKILGEDIRSNNTFSRLICEARHVKGEAKEGKLIFYFTKTIDGKNLKENSIKLDSIEKIYLKLRQIIYKIPKEYAFYKWESESLLTSSSYDKCLVFENFEKKMISANPLFSIIVTHHIVSLDTMKFTIKIYPLTLYLFSWNKIPGNDNENLIYFMRKKFGIDWVNTAKIEKIDDGKTIRLSAGKHSLSLRLNNEETKVNLKIDDIRTDEFTAKMEDSELKIYFTTIDEKFLKITFLKGNLKLKSTEYPLINVFESGYFSDFSFNVPNELSNDLFIIFKIKLTNKDYLLEGLELKKITGIGPLGPRNFKISKKYCDYDIKINIESEFIKNILRNDLLYEVNEIKAKNIVSIMANNFAIMNNIEKKNAISYLGNYFISIQELVPLFLKDSILKITESFEKIEDTQSSDKIIIHNDLIQSFIVKDAFDKSHKLLIEDSLFREQNKSLEHGKT